jgi:hypothetical protein
MDAELLAFKRFISPGSPEAEALEGAATVASAIAQPAPTSYITVVSGTAELTTIVLPWAGFAGTVCFIPTGAFTGATGGTASATAGAIGKAFTAVAAKALFLTYVPSTGLWYPSY